MFFNDYFHEQPNCVHRSLRHDFFMFNDDFVDSVSDDAHERPLAVRRISKRDPHDLSHLGPEPKLVHF